MPKHNSLPARERLLRWFRYEPKTGNLYWRCGKRKGKKAGANQNGYTAIQTNQNDRKWNLKAHRVIWKMVHGEEPFEEIDHINGDRSDNRVENLRAVSVVTNQRNKAKQRGSKTPVQGVSWYPNNNRWHARIGVNGKAKHIGYFSCLGQAVSARKQAQSALNYHPNHGRLGGENADN